jgi:hypothetical protein
LPSKWLSLVKDWRAFTSISPSLYFLLERYIEDRERLLSKNFPPAVAKKRGTDHRFAWFHKGAPTPEGVIFGAKLAKGLSWVAPID